MNGTPQKWKVITLEVILALSLSGCAYLTPLGPGVYNIPPHKLIIAPASEVAAQYTERTGNSVGTHMVVRGFYDPGTGQIWCAGDYTQAQCYFEEIRHLIGNLTETHRTGKIKKW
ncbi:hypothetical protein HYY71_02975 [Candidatus Woesearchaeota archaeon]|nr:hypothetical protein [Candidatus Woesearchaeota archaeon]